MSRFDEEPDGDPHGECAAEIAALKGEVARLREALQKSAELIESEYCSHPGPHAANNKYCYTDFIYAALARAEGDGNG